MYAGILLPLCCVFIAKAAGPSPLFARGYPVIPEPQMVQLSGETFAFDRGWHLTVGAGVPRDSAALDVLKTLDARCGIKLDANAQAGGKTISLTCA